MEDENTNNQGTLPVYLIEKNHEANKLLDMIPLSCKFESPLPVRKTQSEIDLPDLNLSLCRVIPAIATSPSSVISNTPIITRDTNYQCCLVKNNSDDDIVVNGNNDVVNGQSPEETDPLVFNTKVGGDNGTGKPRFIAMRMNDAIKEKALRVAIPLERILNCKSFSGIRAKLQSKLSRIGEKNRMSCRGQVNQPVTSVTSTEDGTILNTTQYPGRARRDGQPLQPIELVHLREQKKTNSNDTSDNITTFGENGRQLINADGCSMNRNLQDNTAVSNDVNFSNNLDSSDDERPLVIDEDYSPPNSPDQDRNDVFQKEPRSSDIQENPNSSSLHTEPGKTFKLKQHGVVNYEHYVVVEDTAIFDQKYAANDQITINFLRKKQNETVKLIMEDLFREKSNH